MISTRLGDTIGVVFQGAKCIFAPMYDTDTDLDEMVTIVDELGYYEGDFEFGSIDDITKALNSGFVYDGTKLNSVYQNYMGEDGSKIEPSKMVVHIQNHDQVGNRPNGDRMIATYGIDKALLAISIVFASPYIPMIFMGEEYGDVNPFLFFESFKDPYLIEAVRNGRKREFSFDENFKPKEPHEVETFIESKLNFDLLTNRENKFIFEYYQN